MLSEYIKHAPPGYVHVSTFAHTNKLNAERVGALAAKSPEAVHVGPYIFVPLTFKVTVKKSYSHARGTVIDRYYLGDGRRRKVGSK